MNILACAGSFFVSQTFDRIGQAADAAHADDRQRRVEHDARGFLQRLRNDRRPIRRRRFAGRVIKQPFRSQHALGKACLLQGFRRATDRRFENRVGKLIFAAGRITAIGQHVMGIEVKAQVFRHVGQPENRGLHADHFARSQQFIKPPGAGIRVAEGFEAHLQTKRLLQALDDGFGRHAVSHQRQAVDFDDGDVGEGQSPTTARKPSAPKSAGRDGAGWRT
jgi:hypothetical protein